MALECISQRSRIRALLESLEEPCWVLATNGVVLIRNDPARTHPGTPGWVLDFLAGRSCTMPLGARVRFITVDGMTVVFATDRTPKSGETADFGWLGLDEIHIEIVQHLMREFSETEIALLLGRSLVIVHALITHIYRKLGVQTRTELVDFAGRVRKSGRPPRRSFAPISVTESRPEVRIEMEAEPYPSAKRY